MSDHRVAVVDHLVTASVQPPLSVDYAKAHLRSLSSAEDELVAIWILAAAQYIEGQTGRQLITATREAWLDRFPPFDRYVGLRTPIRIEIPRPPLQAVSSVLYVNGDGDLVSFSDGLSLDSPAYAVKAPQGPFAQRGWIEPSAGQMWPQARLEGGAVRIQYVCGYGDAPEDIPELLRGVLCYLVAHFDQFRSAVHEARRGQVLELPYGVQVMLDEFKYSAYPAGQERPHVGGLLALLPGVGTWR
jgi:uncharacterized phiE125 gp8 family phage protein